MSFGNSLIYKCKKGYIAGYLMHDGYWFIKKFVVHPRYRNQGFAKTLANYLPQKAKLWPYPLFDHLEEEVLNHEQLVKFYKKLGFEEHTDPFLNFIMIRH